MSSHKKIGYRHPVTQEWFRPIVMRIETTRPDGRPDNLTAFYDEDRIALSPDDPEALNNFAVVLGSEKTFTRGSTSNPPPPPPPPAERPIDRHVRSDVAHLALMALSVWARSRVEQDVMLMGPEEASLHAIAHRFEEEFAKCTWADVLALKKEIDGDS